MISGKIHKTAVWGFGGTSLKMQAVLNSLVSINIRRRIGSFGEITMRKKCSREEQVGRG